MARQFLRHVLLLSLELLLQRASAISDASVDLAACDGPYPCSRRPTGSAPLHVVSHSRLSRADIVTLDTLAGILARDTPRIFRLEDAGGSKSNGDNWFWLRRLRDVYGVETNYTLLNAAAWELAREFRNHIRGYVLFNAQPIDASVNAALMLCSATEALDEAGRGLVAVGEPETAAYLERVLGIPLVRDARGLSEAAAYTELVARDPQAFRAGGVAFQTLEKSSSLADYSVFAGLPTVRYLGADGGPLATRVMEDMHRRCNGKASMALGWGPDEHSYIDRLARYGVYAHATDLSQDLSALTNVQVHAGLRRHPFILGWMAGNVHAAKTESISRDLRSTRSLGQPGDASGSGDKHVVAFVMSDGDNLQYLINSFCTNERYFGSPLRGSFPVGWTVSPALAALAPGVAQYLTEFASENDTLIAAPSGVGYTYPDVFGYGTKTAYTSRKNARERAEPTHSALLDDLSRITTALMTQLGIRILNVIGSDDLGANIIPVEALSVMVGDGSGIDMVFYYPYGACYSGAKGEVAWTVGPNPVPILTPRASLWGNPLEGDEADAVNATAACWTECTKCGVDRLVSAMIQSATVTDRSNPQAYSIIPVHAWTHNLTDVKLAAEALEATGRFEVVSPSVLAQRFPAA